MLISMDEDLIQYVSMLTDAPAIKIILQSLRQLCVAYNILKPVSELVSTNLKPFSLLSINKYYALCSMKIWYSGY